MNLCSFVSDSSRHADILSLATLIAPRFHDELRAFSYATVLCALSTEHRQKTLWQFSLLSSWYLSHPSSPQVRSCTGALDDFLYNRLRLIPIGYAETDKINLVKVRDLLQSLETLLIVDKAD